MGAQSINDKLQKDMNACGIAENAFDKQKELLWNIISNIPYFVFWKDRNSVYLGCNDSFARVAGIEKPEDIIGKTDYDLAWKKEESDFYRQCDKQVMEENEPMLNIEESLRQSDGSERTILTSKVPLRDASGEVFGMLGIYTDITERKKMEERLKNSTQEWQDTFNSITEGISIHSMDFVITNVNASICKMLGKPKEEIIGKKCYQLFHGKDEIVGNCPLEKLKGSKQPEFIELFEPSVNKWITVTASPIFDARGEVAKVIHTVCDITGRKKLEEELRKKMDNLERFNKAAVDRELKMMELKEKIKRLERD